MLVVYLIYLLAVRLKILGEIVEVLEISNTGNGRFYDRSGEEVVDITRIKYD